MKNIRETGYEVVQRYAVVHTILHWGEFAKNL